MMLAIGFCATAPICFLSGALFAFGLGTPPRRRKRRGKIDFRYLAESLGAGAGGLVFYFILLPLYPSFAGSLLLIVFLLAFAMVCGAGLKYPGKLLCSLFAAAILIPACVLFGDSDRVDLLTHRLQWGKTFFQSTDTPYHNLVFLFDSGQFSLFSNGLWLFSSPDPQSAEPAAHVPLLEHPIPRRVLVIGDYSPELPGEVVKHPG